MLPRNSAAPFPSTRWSVVLSLRGCEQSETGQRALEDLCGLYWRPLYAFARGSGFTAEDAEDLTQSFFARVIVEQNLFASAEPTKGKLRTFLLTAFQRDLSDAREAANRQKRGSGKIISFDAAQFETFLTDALSTNAEPLQLFEKQWAESVIRASLDLLKSEYEGEGKSEQFALLRPFIGLGEEAATGYDDLAASTGMAKATLRQMVHRLRERFRKIIRAQIADTLNEPTEALITEELAALQAVLRGSHRR